MRVGLVVYDGLDGISGGYRYDRRLVAYLRNRGDEVSVLSIPRRPYPFRVLDATSHSLRERLNRPFDVLLQDELCHASLWRHNAALDRPGAVVSVVHHLRSSVPGVRFSRPIGAVERRYLRSVDGAVCVSRDTRARVSEHGVGPTTVAPPAGRHEGAAVSAARVRERARRGPLRIAFVGSVVPRKGLSSLLSALERVDEEWRLSVAGSLSTKPAYARSVVRRARRLGIDDRVAFRGYLSDAALRRLYERSHVLAVPSRFEGFGMVYLEAMEYGVVPIASARGGANDVVTHGENGFLVRPADRRTITDVLAALAADRERLASMGEAALEAATSHPTWADSMERARSFCAALAGVEAAATRSSEAGAIGGESP